MASQSRVFTPEHLAIIRRTCERVRRQRKLPPQGAEAKRLARKAIELFSSGYVWEGRLSRALREDA
jgi:hypothetical protein